MEIPSDFVLTADSSLKECNTYKLVFKSVQNDPKTFMYASAYMKNKANLLFEALKYGKNLQYTNMYRRDTIPFVRMAVSHDPSAFQYASCDIRANDAVMVEFICAGVSLDIFQYVESEVKENVNNMMLYIKNNYDIYKYLSTEMKMNYNIIQVMLKKKRRIAQLFKYCTPEMMAIILSDESNVITLIHHDFRRYRYMPEIWKTCRQHIIWLINANYNVIDLMPDWVRDDIAIAKVVVKKNRNFIRYFNYRVKLLV